MNDRWFWRRRNVEAEIDDELASHLALCEEDLRERGISPDAACDAARARFGDLARTKALCRAIDERHLRELRRSDVIHDFLHDIKYAWRTILRAPGFASAAIVALALGIGANTAIFSVVHAVLLRPLPYRDTDRLAVVWNATAERPRFALTPGRFVDVRDRSSAFEAIAGISQISYTLTGRGEPERLAADSVSANFFDVLGVGAARGRTFSSADSGRRVVVLSHEVWTEHFGSDESLIGRDLVLDGIPYTVLGVMPPDFVWPQVTPLASNADPPLFWAAAVDHDVPAMHVETTDLPSNRRFGYLRAIGRINRKVTIAQAQSQLDRVAQQLGREFPDTDGGTGLSLVPLRTQFLGDVRRPLVVLAGAVAFVLAIACANVASLLLGRAAARRRELAVRVALGAGRGRVIRQLVTEAVLLSLIAAAAGVVLASLATPALVALSPARVLRLDQSSVDLTVMAFTVALSIATGIAFGLVPALQAAGFRTHEALKEGAVRSSTRGGARLRDALAVAQVAVALILVTGAGLLLRSFITLQHTPTGIDTTNLLTFDIALSARRAEYQRLQVAFYEEMLDRIRRLPGVRAAGAAVTLPIGGDDFAAPVFVEGEPDPPPGREASAGFQIVSAGYFDAMKIAVEDGRDFRASDIREAPPVAIVNRTFARMHWPGQTAIGRRFRTSRDGPWTSVVGVISDVRHFGPAAPPRPEFYRPYTQNSMSFMAVVVRTAVDPLTIVPMVRREVAAIDSAQPIANVNTMEAHLGRSTSEPRFMATLVAAFATLALMLASLGIYATVAFSVSQRTREIGIRVALGATRRLVLGVILGRGLLLAGTGIVLGVVVSLALTRVLARMLYGVTPTDAWTFSAVAVGFAGIALLACAVPAFRATRVDPVVTLRAD